MGEKKKEAGPRRIKTKDKFQDKSQDKFKTWGGANQVQDASRPKTSARQVQDKFQGKFQDKFQDKCKTWGWGTSKIRLQV